MQMFFLWGEKRHLKTICCLWWEVFILFFSDVISEYFKARKMWPIYLMTRVYFLSLKLPFTVSDVKFYIFRSQIWIVGRLDLKFFPRVWKKISTWKKCSSSWLSLLQIAKTESIFRRRIAKTPTPSKALISDVFVRLIYFTLCNGTTGT
jgi:hypothetical protein